MSPNVGVPLKTGGSVGGSCEAVTNAAQEQMTNAIARPFPGHPCENNRRLDLLGWGDVKYHRRRKTDYK